MKKKVILSLVALVGLTALGTKVSQAKEVKEGDNVYWVVQSGDYLSKIADTYDVSYTVIHGNNEDSIDHPDLIFADQKILVGGKDFDKSKEKIVSAPVVADVPVDNTDVAMDVVVEDYSGTDTGYVESTPEVAYSAPEASSTGNGMAFQATAYTHTGNPTASGIMPYPGVIAVDPSVIPLGTYVTVTGAGAYDGVYLAADTGGAIGGNIIDIFMNSHDECVNWGRRTVYVSW